MFVRRRGGEGWSLIFGILRYLLAYLPSDWHIDSPNDCLTYRLMEVLRICWHIKAIFSG